LSPEISAGAKLQYRYSPKVKIINIGMHMNREFYNLALPWVVDTLIWEFSMVTNKTHTATRVLKINTEFQKYRILKAQKNALLWAASSWRTVTMTTLQWRRQRGGRGEASPPPMGGRPKIM